MKNKKWKLLKKAYDNYPKGTNCKCYNNSYEFGIIETSGKFTINGEDINDTNGNGIYENGKWADIIVEFKPKSILDGKVVIQVNNEREFKLLMEHFESKGWILHNRRKPTDQEFSSQCWASYKNRSDFKYVEKYIDITVIPFSDFAKEAGIEVPKFIMKSEDGVDLYEGDEYCNVWQNALNTEWNLGANVKLQFADGCIRDPARFKAFHSKENALKWIEQQNKSKTKTLPLYFDQEAIINFDKSEVRIMDGHKEVSTLSFGDINDLQNAINKIK